jgi:hypothetical protein
MTAYSLRRYMGPVDDYLWEMLFPLCLHLIAATHGSDPSG